MTRKVQIQIEGQLDDAWKEWFDGFEFKHKKNSTILIGEIIDESHIYGILNKIRDLNLKLISVNPI